MRDKTDEANVIERKQIELKSQFEKLAQTMTMVKFQLMEKTRCATEARKKLEAMSQENKRIAADERRKAAKVDDLNDQLAVLKVKLERTQKSCRESKNTAELAEGALKLLRAKDKAKTLDLAAMEKRLEEKTRESLPLKENETQLRQQLEQLTQTIVLVRIELEEKTRALTEAQRKIAEMTEEKSRIVREWQEKLEKGAKKFKASEKRIRKFTASIKIFKQKSLKAESRRLQVSEKLRETMKTMKKIRGQAASSLKAQCEMERRTKEEIGAMKTIVVEQERKLEQLRTDMLELKSAEAELKADILRSKHLAGSAQAQSSELTEKVQALGLVNTALKSKITKLKLVAGRQGKKMTERDAMLESLQMEVADLKSGKKQLLIKMTIWYERTQESYEIMTKRLMRRYQHNRPRSIFLP